MNCIFCKKELPPEAVFCCFCGKKQKAPVRSPKKRGNGQGTIFKRGSGYAVEITVGYICEDGKLKRKSRRKQGFKTKREAAAYLETLRAAAEKPASVSISKLYNDYIATADLSSSLLSGYKTAYKRISPLLAHRKIDSLTVNDLQNAVDSTAHTYATQRDIKQLLLHLYKLALRDDLIDKNRASFIKILPVPESNRQVFTDKEIDIVWKDYAETGDIMSAAVLIMLYTGMRPGEVRQLNPDNIHLSEHYLTGGIKTAKGKRRKIIIPEKIEPILQAYINAGGYYAGVSHSLFALRWTKKRQELGINPALTLHCCRHTFITRLTALNVSPAMLQELVGHEDYETTLNYTHLSVSDRLQAVNKL